MRIVHFITSLAFAGAEKQVVTLAKEAKKNDYVVTVVTFINCLGMQDELKINGIEVLCVDYKGIFSLPNAILKLKKIIEYINPCVIHSHMTHMIILARLFLSNKNVKLVETFHNEPHELKWFMPILLKLTSNKSAFSSCVSGSMLKEVKRARFSKKYAYIPNGIEGAFFDKNLPYVKNKSCNSFKWVSIGRLIDKKGFDNLLRACHLLNEIDNNFTLDIFGEGPLKNELKIQIDSLGLNGKVSLKGISHNLANELKEYDGFVSPSKVEAFGIVIIEALAAGLPVCVTDCIGPVTILGENPSCGLIVRKSNINALLDGMSQIMKCDFLVKDNMSKEAFKLAKNFDAENIFLKWANVYNKV